MTQASTPQDAPRPLRVLIIEDSEDDAALLLRALRKGGYQPLSECVQSAKDLSIALSRGPWDVVLSDHSMPSFSSTDGLQMVQQHDPDLPFIIVSGSIGEEVAVAAMRDGASDFVMKDHPGRLVPAIERELRDAQIRRARREAEAALRASEARYRELVEELPAVTYIAGLDEARTVFFISGQIDRMLGIGPGDHRHLWRTFMHPEDRQQMADALHQAIASRGPFTCEYRLVRPDGRSVWIQDNGVLVRDERGQPSFLRGFMLNITERKEAEALLLERNEQLRRVQKLEAIGRLAGGIAHDFNNLLTPVLGYAHLLQQQLEGEPDARRSVDEIMRAAERASKLTRQLLTFSRRKSEAARLVDINTILSGIHEFLRRTIGEDVELVMQLSEAPVVVEADPTNVEQVIMNLAVNARDAMDRGGELTIRTAVESVDAETAGRFNVPPGPYAQLVVKDTGCGMTPEVREHVFEPFFTTKPESRGTGLGLSITYGIVKQAGGFIDLDSSPGEGTELRLYFPCQHGAPGTDAAGHSDAPRGTETILVVEDEEAVRDLTVRLLQSLGYATRQASSATSALALWKKNQDAIHAVVTDVVMPQMGGRELAAELRRQRPTLPILFISGFDRSTNDPDNDHTDIPLLMKPFARDALAHALREALDAPR